MNIDLFKLKQTDPERAKQVAELLGVDLDSVEEKKVYPKKLPKIMKPEQVEKMLSVINLDTVIGVRQMAIAQTMLLAGLRISELCNATVDDIDLVNNDIFVQQGKYGRDRHIPIGANLKHYLEEWDAIRPDSEWFFCGLKGQKTDTRVMRQLIYGIAAKADIYIRDGGQKKKVNPHLLRHVYATNLLNAGYNIREVQTLLGHKDVSTTMIYTEICLDEIRKKVKDTGWL